ncbi:MAG: hypothetical protein Kow0097_02000 [Candidatus Bipolaricaulota bacterium]
MGGLVAVWVTAPPDPAPVTVRGDPDEGRPQPPPVGPDRPGREVGEGAAPAERSLVPEMPVEPEAPTGPPVPVPLAPYSSSGLLAYAARGRVLGQESYALTVSAQGVTLESTGSFAVRLLVVPVRVTFTQAMVIDAQVRLVSYALHVRAPLGMSRRIVAQVEDGYVTVASGDEQSVVALGPGPAVVLGMLSTLAILPALVAGSPDEVVEFQVLLVGGPPSSGAGGGRAAPAVVRVESLGERAILAGEGRIVVDAYLLHSAIGDTLLLAKERDFLAARMGEGSNALYVYRRDYFPDGFELWP